MVYKKLLEEDQIIIKYLRRKFGYETKRIIKDHPEKNWGLRNVGYLLERINETGDVKRREGSGRPKSSRTKNNINAVKELISSQKDKPGTHATPNEVSKMMDIPRTSIRRIIAQDLNPNLLNVFFFMDLLNVGEEYSTKTLRAYISNIGRDIRELFSKIRSKFI